MWLMVHDKSGLYKNEDVELQTVNSKKEKPDFTVKNNPCILSLN